MVPKKIFTIWLGSEIPEEMKGWIETQKLPGYEHKIITLDNCFKDAKYIQECLTSPHEKKKWVKLSDFLRIYYLLTEGGIYLDSDVEILPGKNFDSLLDNRIFTAREKNGFLGTSVIGGEPKHPFFLQVMEKMITSFKGDDDLVFQSGMETFSLGHRDGFNIDGFKVLEPEIFFPYNHQENTVNVRPDTITYHHFKKSWL